MGRYQGRGEPTEDLIQVAMLGLLKAISRFDPSRGFAFSTYATPTMLGEIKRYFRDAGWAVHVPRGVKERALEVARVSDELSSRLGHSPSLSELAEALGASEEQTLEAIEAYHARQAPSLEHAGDDELGLSPAEHARGRGRTARAGGVPERDRGRRRFAVGVRTADPVPALRT